MEQLMIGEPLAPILLIILIAVIYYAVKRRSITYEPPHKRAGRAGERFAEGLIRSVMREGDHLFTNVPVTHDGKRTELDDVIVNKYGVFIIEVKNFSGRLSGSEDDHEWTKTHISRAGNQYLKTVRNPIRQVKREVDILAKYLRSYNVSAWVEGYVLILGADCPIDSDRILRSNYDIDRVIHTFGKKPLNKTTVDSVAILLS